MNDPNRRGTAKRAYQLQNIEVSSPTGVNDTKSSGLTLASFETADIRNVADLFATVKSREKKFRPKPASKAVNSDGTPKVYYHGTNAEWTAYDLSKNVNQMWGEGIYLAETEERARLYGENVIPLYVRALYNNRDARRLGTQRDHVRMSNGDLLVFSPEQIKAAEGNVGTFDGMDPDIRYSVDKEQEQKPKAAKGK